MFQLNLFNKKLSSLWPKFRIPNIVASFFNTDNIGIVCLLLVSTLMLRKLILYSFN